MPASRNATGAAAAAVAGASDDVPRRLLDAASEIFAEKGYDGTTVREVVARARTNLNSVNYHFGSKEQLYGAVMKHQAALAEAAHPRHRRGKPADAREALAQTVEDVVAWLLDPESLLPRLYARELLNPSPAFALVNVGGAEHEALHAAVTELLGPRALPADVANCCRSVYSQCAYFMFVRQVLPMMDPGFRYTPEKVRELAGHITRFSLAGIAAIRRECEQE